MVDLPINTYELCNNNNDHTDQSEEEEFVDLAEVTKAYTSTCNKIIIAATEQWFQATTYSLSTGRLRVIFKLTYRDFLVRQTTC